MTGGIMPQPPVFCSHGLGVDETSGGSSGGGGGFVEGILTGGGGKPGKPPPGLGPKLLGCCHGAPPRGGLPPRDPPNPPRLLKPPRGGPDKPLRWDY